MSLPYSVFHGIRSIKIEESEIDLPIQGLETHTICICIDCAPSYVGSGLEHKGSTPLLLLSENSRASALQPTLVAELLSLHLSGSVTPSSGYRATLALVNDSLLVTTHPTLPQRLSLGKHCEENPLRKQTTFARLVSLTTSKATQWREWLSWKA